jgi:hypothetical protein
MPLPKTGAGVSEGVKFSFFASDPAGNREQMARAARALGGQWREEVKEATGYDFYYLHGRLDGLHVSLCGVRDEVCEQVVVGRRTVEDVQWRGPLEAASPGADVDHAIAADLDEQTATRVPLDVVGDEPRPDLYVVVNVEPDGRRVTVTDPGLKDQCERYVRENARYHAGTLEVAPARPEDLDDADGER